MGSSSGVKLSQHLRPKRNLSHLSSLTLSRLGDEKFRDLCTQYSKYPNYLIGGRGNALNLMGFFTHLDFQSATVTTCTNRGIDNFVRDYSVSSLFHEESGRSLCNYLSPSWWLKLAI